MDKLINQLPERGLINGIRQADQLVSEQKSAQRISGASGQLNYAISSANTWDVTDTLPNVTSSTNIQFLVTFTPDGTQDWPEAVLFVDVRINGTDDTHKLQWLNGTYGGVTYVGAFGWSD